jgi:hypothetical protein
MRDLHVTVPGGAIRWLAVGFLAALVGELSSENVTLTTYYPAPSGVYKQLITTEGTALSRESGTVTIGENSAAAGVKLDVRGGVRVGSSAFPPPASLSASAAGAGALIYDSTGKRFLGSDGTAWRPMSATISCAAGRAFSDNNHVNHTVKFTAAECGGVLPDSTYTGMAKSILMCNGVEHFHVLDAGESSAGLPANASLRTGPGVSIYPATSGPGPCIWPGSTVGTSVVAVYIKK